MEIEKTGVLCEQFMKVYKGISGDLTKHISDVLQRYDDDGVFDSSIAPDVTKLWWVTNCFTSIIPDNEVFDDTSLLDRRAEIISDYCDIKQEQIVEAFKELGAMAKRTEDTSINPVDEAMRFIFTIYNIVSPDSPISPDTENFDDDIVSRIMTDVQIAFSEGNICKQAIRTGVM